MPFASELTVNATLRPYLPALSSLLLEAFEDWLNGPYAATLQDPKVRACVVWNQFLYRAKSRFEGVDGISVDARRHWQGVNVGNFFIRMKKGNGQLLSRNYPTRSATDFNDASVDLFDGVVRLELLYKLNDLESGIERIVVAQRHRDKILWAIDLLDGDAGTQTVIPMPVQPLGGTPAQRVIRPKKNVEKIEKFGSKDATE